MNVKSKAKFSTKWIYIKFNKSKKVKQKVCVFLPRIENATKKEKKP